EGGAVAAALAAEQLALAGAKLLEALHVFIIYERRPGTPFLGAEPAAVFPSPSELLADHRYPHSHSFVLVRSTPKQTINIGKDGKTVNGQARPKKAPTCRLPSSHCCTSG